MSITRSVSLSTRSSSSEDLYPILAELDLQADHVLGSLAVLRSMDQKYAQMTDESDRREYATVIHFQVAVLEMDLGVIKLDAELVTDEQIHGWVEGTAGLVEKEEREQYVWELFDKLGTLQDKMVETRRRMVDGILG